MGGNGSGRWHEYRRRLTTGACMTLDAVQVLRMPAIRQALRRPYCHTPTLYFQPVGNTLTGDPDPVQLTSTLPTFGGKRWWFVCPFHRADGIPCGRRVRMLYLPPGARHFGCRHCHHLTYHSAQTHDKRVDAVRRLSMGEIISLATSDNPISIELAIHALGQIIYTGRLLHS